MARPSAGESTVHVAVTLYGQSAVNGKIGKRFSVSSLFVLTNPISTKAARSLAFWLLILFPTHAFATDPDKKITQYAHTAWRTQDGYFSGAPHAITQTADGYIWIGTQN